jgi:hypothetical protein
VIARLLVAAALLAVCAPARADVVLRGNYWRDRNTRVLSPEAIISKEFGKGTVVGANYLLDAITSASASAGAALDHPFTELRNEFGVMVGQRVGPALIQGRYSYSTESDYWAHTASLGAVFDLFRHNTQLGFSLAYGNDTVGQRNGPTGFIVRGGLERVSLIASWTQTLTRTLLLDVSFDFAQHGFGTQDNGFQSNPYRSATVAGAPQREQTPFIRDKFSLAGVLYWVLPTGNRIMPFIGFRPGVRFYYDDWDVKSITAELRTHIPVGPVEFRVTGRYMKQTGASFWRDTLSLNGIHDNVPNYTMPVGCPSCLTARQQSGQYFTSDPKLSPFEDVLLDVRLLVKLRFLNRLSSWLGGGILELSYGHLFNDKWAHTQWGDADLAGLAFAFPL